MNIILISLIALELFMIFYLILNRIAKRKNGEEIIGEKIGEKFIPGRPNRYVITVKLRSNGVEMRKKFVTSD